MYKMGYLKNKVDRLANELSNKFCLGESKYLNKKRIAEDVSLILFKFLIAQYKNYRNQDTFSLKSFLNNEQALNVLVLRLQYPLSVVKRRFVSEDKIDLQNIIALIQIFLKQNEKLINRNLKKVVKKNLDLISDSSGESVLKNLEDSDSEYSLDEKNIPFELVSPDDFDKLNNNQINRIMIKI